MKKIIVAMFVMMALAGCVKQGYQSVGFESLPKELSDCTFTRLTNADLVKITVARCPLSTTTVVERTGKITRTTITIDGVEYESKEKK